MKHRKSINTIVHDQLIGSISEEDKDRLQSWLDRSPRNQNKYDNLLNGASLVDRYRKYAQAKEERGWKRIQRKYFAIHAFQWRKIGKYAAALMLPLAGIAAWLWVSYSTTDAEPAISHETRVAMIRSERLGKQKAELVLSDGRKMELQSSPSKSVQALTTLPVKGAAQHTLSKEETSPDNKLITYHNSEFWVTLEDGTRIHLNYSTTLSYPSHFSDDSRTVYLEGEAYFEVAKDSERPFRVVTKDGTIQQYGTAFNVTTQGGTDTKVVLVSGSVSVITNSGKEFKMNPGELAILEHNEPEVKISKVEVEPYVAWNKGRFVFYNCSLEALMNVLSNWYGKDVVFQSEDIRKMRFTGDMDRYESIMPIVKAIRRVTGLKIEVTEDAIHLEKL